MRKRIIGTEPVPESNWLDLASLASVEVTSEDPAHGIEAAFSNPPTGWRAAAPGEQTIRLVFDNPTAVRQVRLVFEEAHAERTQEFTLSYNNGTELIRQQYTFSPGGSTREVEDYRLDLAEVHSLELRLKPDLSPERAVASLAGWWVA